MLVKESALVRILRNLEANMRAGQKTPSGDSGQNKP